MSNERSTAPARPEKSPARAKLELRRQYKLLHRTNSTRGTSAPARISGPSESEERRSSSPRRSLVGRADCSGHTDSRSPRAQQRLRTARRCHSETCSPLHSRTSPLREMSTLSDTDLALQRLCQIITSLDEQDGRRKAENFLNASLDPPITKHSLSELDIGSIVANSKLRHDVNFDRELHFRPNLDGAKGRAKRKAQTDYWSALVAELELYAAILVNPAILSPSRVARDTLQRVCSRRIPRMFETVKDLLKALVPEAEHAIIDEHMDVPMIMQEIGAGVCDLPRVARWLANTLKAHCAPMRDHTIDKMVKYIDRGVAQNKAKYLVDGLIQMFGAVEAMKLDVANHQIRQLRMVLIEDTIKFEQRYHIDRISRGRIDIVGARLWYQEAAWQLELSSRMDSNRAFPAFSPLISFLSAVLDTLLNPACATFPDTFKLDTERLKCIRSDLYDLFCIDASERVFIQLAAHRPIPFAQRGTFRSTISTIVNHSSYGSSWEDNIQNIAAETARQLAAATGSWQRPEEAAQLREDAEEMLHAIFSDPSRSFLAERALAVRQQLLLALQTQVGRYDRASMVDIFNAFLPSPTSLPQQKRGPVRPYDADDVMADAVRRISHIAIVHWRVWAPIVYLNGPEPTTLPTRHIGTLVMSRSSSRDSPAPLPQFLPSNSPGADLGAADAVHAESEGDTGEPDVAEQTPRTVAGSELQPQTEDPSSPVLYRQRSSN